MVLKYLSSLGGEFNRSRKQYSWCKWEFFWLNNQAATPGMAPDWEFNCLCCCKQPVHVLCIKMAQKELISAYISSLVNTIEGVSCGCRIGCTDRLHKQANRFSVTDLNSPFFFLFFFLLNLWILSDSFFIPLFPPPLVVSSHHRTEDAINGLGLEIRRKCDLWPPTRELENVDYLALELLLLEMNVYTFHPGK